jgi:hypothetical protein
MLKRETTWYETVMWDLWLIPRNIIFATFCVGLVQYFRVPILQEYLMTNNYDWFPFKPLLETLGGLVFLNYVWKISTFVLRNLFTFLGGFVPPKKVRVAIEDEEMLEKLEGYPKFDPSKLVGEANVVHMWDPATMDYFGSKPAMNAAQVKEAVEKARKAQAAWKKSSFRKRRQLMRIMQRYFTENQETCARVAVRDSGKTMLDALIGEVLVTCEKLAWLEKDGEKYLRPEPRDTGRMMLMKKVHVEFVPLGVIGAIVPWNYPFHNVFNPVSAALFSGNAIVIKVRGPRPLPFLQ